MKNLLKALLSIVVLMSFMMSANAATDKIFISVPKAANAQQKQAIQLVKAYYKALNAKDMQRFFTIMDPNVIHDINQGDTEQGVTKFKSFMEAGNASFDEKLNNIIIMVSQDGKYAAAHWIDQGHYYKTYPGLGVNAHNQTYTLMGGHFFVIRNGKIYRVTTYYNDADFMAQIKK